MGKPPAWTRLHGSLSKKTAQMLKGYSNLCIMISNVPLAEGNHEASLDSRGTKAASTSVPYCLYLGRRRQEGTERDALRR